MWPACKPAASDDGADGRIGARACACARAICSPALGRGLGPVRRRRRRVLVGHPACLPHRPYPPAALPACLCASARSPSGAQTMMASYQSSAPPSAPPSQTRAPARFSPATAAPPVAALPMRAPAKSGASDVATGAEQPSEIARVFRVRSRECFFLGSAETLPQVVLRKYPPPFPPHLTQIPESCPFAKMYMARTQRAQANRFVHGFCLFRFISPAKLVFVQCRPA